MEQEDLIGRTVGRFRILRRIGRGGMATVYLASQQEIGSRVAVKVLNEKYCANRRLVEHFKAEAMAVNLIGHENIVNIFALGVLGEGRPYLVMEFLDGEALADLLDAQVKLPADRALPILIQVCDALHAAHGMGVIHRDIKPENIFLVRHRRDPNFVKVLDFGLAQLASFEIAAAKHEVMGTPTFMAPEQWGGAMLDARTDVYALGGTAYQALTGRVPFDRKNIAELAAAHQYAPPVPLTHLDRSIPPPVSGVIMRALAKRPQDRFATAEELGLALEHALEVVRQAHAPPRLTPVLVEALRAEAPEAPKAAGTEPVPPPKPKAFPAPPPMLDEAPPPRRAPAAAAPPPAAPGQDDRTGVVPGPAPLPPEERHAPPPNGAAARGSFWKRRSGSAAAGGPARKARSRWKALGATIAVAALLGWALGVAIGGEARAHAAPGETEVSQVRGP